MKIDRNFNYEDTNLSIYYFGESTNNNINEKNIKNLIDDIFSNCNIVDIEQAIIVIRTILKDYKEEFLSLCLKFDNDENSVTFRNGELNRYRNYIAVNHIDENSDMIEFIYEPNKDLKLSVSNKVTDIQDDFKIKQLYRFYMEELDVVSRLINPKSFKNQNEEIAIKSLRVMKKIYNNKQV